MRLLIIVLSFLLLLSVLGFLFMNTGATIAVTVGNTHYPAVPLHWVTLGSLLAGILYIGIIAVAEGVNLRLDRRRLAREVQRLEGELNYLRTQPTVVPGDDVNRREVETVAVEPEPEDEGLAAYATDDDRATIPSAPVYGADDEEDDDIYSGGRAV
jgi:uncharacterized integral membrane protein